MGINYGQQGIGINKGTNLRPCLRKGLALSAELRGHNFATNEAPEVYGRPWRSFDPDERGAIRKRIKQRDRRAWREEYEREWAKETQEINDELRHFFAE